MVVVEEVVLLLAAVLTRVEAEGAEAEEVLGAPVEVMGMEGLASITEPPCDAPSVNREPTSGKKSGC